MIESYLISKAISLLLENFNIFEASRLFGVDYKNLCSYCRGRKTMPLKLAFKILDYFEAKVVVFRKF